MSAKYGHFDRDANGLYVGTVYRYTLTTAGPWYDWPYIGSTTCELDRQSDWKNVKSSYAGAGIEQGRKMFGLAAFTYDVLERVYGTDPAFVIKEMKRLETAYIIKYDSVRNGFNLTYGVGKMAVQVKVTDASGVVTIYPSMTEAGKTHGYFEGSVRYYCSTGKPDKNGVRFERLP